VRPPTPPPGHQGERRHSGPARPGPHRRPTGRPLHPIGGSLPGKLRQRPPVLALHPRHQPQQVRPGPQPRLPPEERRGHHLSEHLIKVRQPPGRVDPVNAGHHGHSMINQDSHTQMIMRRPSSRHLATPRALTKCCCPTKRHGQRPSRLARRRSRGDDAGTGAAVQTGDRADQDPGPDRDGDPGARAGPLPGRPVAVRVPAGRRRAAPEQGPCVVGAAGAPAGTDPRPFRSSAGCSPSGWPDTALRGSPGP